MRRAWSAAVVAVALGGGGCALLGRGEPVHRQHYAPVLAPGPASPPAPRPGLEVRLGRVTAPRSLDERMMVRTSELEVDYRPGWRWTDRPEEYLRRALGRELFEERGLGQRSRMGTPTLDVELVAFEEVATPHVGRVTVVASLSEGQGRWEQRTITAERPVVPADSEDGAAVARAIGDALSEVVDRLGELVVAGLGEGEPALAPASAEGR